MNILLSQVTGVASSKECALLKTCRYWHTDVRLISPHILETVHKELEQDHGHVTADRCMKALMDLVFYDFLTGRIDSSLMLNYELPVRSGEIAFVLQCLNKLAGMERSAVLFSLIEEITLTDSVRLIRGDVNPEHLKQASVDLLRSVPVHFGFPFVFWSQEPDDRDVVPLFEFKERFRELTKMSWPRFARCISLAGIDFTKATVCSSDRT